MESIDKIKESDFGDRLSEFHGKYFLNLIGVSGAQRERGEILIKEALEEGVWIRAYHKRMPLPPGASKALEKVAPSLKEKPLKTLMSAPYGFIIEVQEDVEPFRVDTIVQETKEILASAIGSKVPVLIVGYGDTCFVVDEMDLEEEHKKLKVLLSRDMDVLDFLKASDKLGSTGWIGSP